MDEIERLKVKLRKMQDRQGWKQTAEAIRKRIEELENGQS